MLDDLAIFHEACSLAESYQGHPGHLPRVRPDALEGGCSEAVNCEFLTSPLCWPQGAS